MSSKVLTLACVLLSLASTRSSDILFRTQMVDPGASETAAVADVNRDGRLDIVSGDSWYEAPASSKSRSDAPSSWTKHIFRELGFSNNYIDAMSDLTLDVDADGYSDVVTVSWFAKKVSWYRNPGKAAGKKWTETIINSGFNVEFAILADIDNDGKAHEILAQENAAGQSWYQIVNRSWVKHVISDRSYGHGIGAGDVNGDKRNDILTPRGWLEAPPDPRSANWTYHPAWESVNLEITPPTPPPAPAAGSSPRVASLGFMHVFDVNADGRNDVITAAGHDYGVFWFEQGAGGKWIKRVIDNTWSQGHASTLVDLNGDARLDFVTGKRYMAHNGSDPGEREALGVYWYEFRPAAVAPAGSGAAASQRPPVEWIRHLVDYGGRVGGGLQMPVVDIDADGDLDIVCPGKSGLFLVENLTKRSNTR